MKQVLQIAFALVMSLAVAPALAAYPSVPKEDQAKANQMSADVARHSDEAWQRALPVIKEGEAKGKPYLPGAAKPDDLPQADIPAFPGAQGGGMYSFGGRGGRVMVVTSLEDRGPGTLREA